MLEQSRGTTKKSLRKVLVLALTFMLVAFSSLMPVVSAAVESDIETMKNSSVRVLITQGGRLMGKGSGFVIDDGKHIVTNYHVIEAVEKKGAQAWVALGRGRDIGSIDRRVLVAGLDPGIGPEGEQAFDGNDVRGLGVHGVGQA